MDVIGIRNVITYWLVVSFFLLLVCFFSFTYIPAGSNYALAVQSTSTFLGALAGAGIAGYLTVKVSKDNWNRQINLQREKQNTYTSKKLSLILNTIANSQKQKELKPSTVRSFDYKIEQFDEKIISLKQHQQELMDLFYSNDSYYLDKELKDLLFETNELIIEFKSTLVYFVNLLQEENLDRVTINNFIINNYNREVESAKEKIKKLNQQHSV